MTSIQQQAAELAEEFKSCGDEYTETDIAYRMADLLRQIVGIGGDVEPVAWANIDSIIRGEPRRIATRKTEAEYFNKYLYCVDPLFTQQALDAARLAGFEAGQNRPWAARKIESLIQERDAAIARADSAFEAGRRNGLEDSASVLPGVYYMDPPDGGDVPIIEQLRRMSEDARRYRWLRDEAEGCDWEHIGYQEPAYTDAAVDKAMEAFKQDQGVR